MENETRDKDYFVWKEDDIRPLSPEEEEEDNKRKKLEAEVADSAKANK